jgi:Fur family peroxide stress response transcriptional regulator
MIRAVETRLHQAGYRVTKQRATVYNYLLSTGSHPTAEAIYVAVRHEMPHISLATVYKAVDSLIDVGLVSRIQRGSSSARYDADVKDHAHCRCLGCDGIWDANHDAMHEGDPTPKTFEVVHVNVEFVGYCGECRDKLGPLPQTPSN